MSKLTINGWKRNPLLYSLGFKSIRVGLVIHGWLFKNKHFVWSEAIDMLVNDLLKLNNGISAFLISSNIIVYHVFSLNIYEY